jgi:hypothetical protein
MRRRGGSVLPRTIDLFPLPGMYRSVTLKEVQPVLERNDPVAWQTAMDWLADFPVYLQPSHQRTGQGLVLSGPAGRGKSMLAAAIVNRLLEIGRRHSAGWVGDTELDTLLRDFRARRFRSDDEDEIMDRLQRVAHCVVVDDALHFGGTDEYVEPFLRQRSDNGRPTIVTINNGINMSASLTSFLRPWPLADFGGPDLRT